MRIEFAQGSRAPVAWAGGVLRIGSAADSDVRLEGDGVAVHHLRLASDRRGLVLEVERGAGRVYANARPVRERAIVHLGDTLAIGAQRLMLCADGIPDAPAEGIRDDVQPATATMALRAVAGPLSGRVWALAGRLDVGPQGPAGVPGMHTLVLRADGHGVRMDGAALDASMPVRVNGIATRHASLRDGDQLALGVHRFLLDVSAPPAAGVPVAPSPVAPAPPPRRMHREMGWLIATAVLVALVLAWVLLMHFPD